MDIISKFKNVNFLEGKPYKTILLFSVPLIITSLLNLLFTFVDSIIIGQLAPKSFAGVSDVGSIYRYVALVSDACSVGFSTVIANLVGKNNKDDIRKSYKKSIFLCIVFGLSSAIIFSFFSDNLLYLLGLSKEADIITYNSAKIYYLVLTICFPITILQNIYIANLRALGNSSKPFIYLTTASILNILLTWLTVYIFPTYELKVFGAAISTILSNLYCLLISRHSINKLYPYVSIKNKEDTKIKIDDSISKELLKTAIPLMLQYVAVAISMFVISKSFISFDNVPGKESTRDVQIAKDVANKINSFGYCIFGGVTNSLMYFVATNNGANNKDRIKKGIKDSIIILFIFLIIQLLYCLLLTTYNSKFIYLIVDESEVNSNTLSYIHFMTMVPSIMCIAKIFTDTYTRVLIGLKNTLYPVLATIIEIPFRFLIVFGMRNWFFEDPYSLNALILVSSAESLTWICSAITVTIGIIRYNKKSIE